jgi:hypothetical protein
MKPTRIGSRFFVDGVKHDAFVGDDGRQYVLDREGNPIYGVWIYIPEPDPIVISSGTPKLGGDA